MDWQCLALLVSGATKMLDEGCFCDWTAKSCKGTPLIFSQDGIPDTKRVV